MPALNRYIASVWRVFRIRPSHQRPVYVILPPSYR